MKKTIIVSPYEGDLTEEFTGWESPENEIAILSVNEQRGYLIIDRQNPLGVKKYVIGDIGNESIGIRLTTEQAVDFLSKQTPEILSLFVIQSMEQFTEELSAESRDESINIIKEILAKPEYYRCLNVAAQMILCAVLPSIEAETEEKLPRPVNYDQMVKNVNLEYGECKYLQYFAVRDFAEFWTEWDPDGFEEVDETDSACNIVHYIARLILDCCKEDESWRFDDQKQFFLMMAQALMTDSYFFEGNNDSAYFITKEDRMMFARKDFSIAMKCLENRETYGYGLSDDDLRNIAFYWSMRGQPEMQALMIQSEKELINALNRLDAVALDIAKQYETARIEQDKLYDVEWQIIHQYLKANVVMDEEHMSTMLANINDENASYMSDDLGGHFFPLIMAMRLNLHEKVWRIYNGILQHRMFHCFVKSKMQNRIFSKADDYIDFYRELLDHIKLLWRNGTIRSRELWHMPSSDEDDTYEQKIFYKFLRNILLIENLDEEFLLAHMGTIRQLTILPFIQNKGLEDMEIGDEGLKYDDLEGEGFEYLEYKKLEAMAMWYEGLEYDDLEGDELKDEELVELKEKYKRDCIASDGLKLKVIRFEKRLALEPGLLATLEQEEISEQKQDDLWKAAFDIIEFDRAEIIKEKKATSIEEKSDSDQEDEVTQYSRDQERDLMRRFTGSGYVGGRYKKLLKGILKARSVISGEAESCSDDEEEYVTYQEAAILFNEFFKYRDFEGFEETDALNMTPESIAINLQERFGLGLQRAAERAEATDMDRIRYGWFKKITRSRHAENSNILFKLGVRRAQSPGVSADLATAKPGMS